MFNKFALEGVPRALAIAAGAARAPAFAAPPQNGVSRGPVIAADAPNSRTLRDLGRASQTLPVRIALTLHYQHESELDRLIALQSDPRSRYYHRYVSDRQFADYFAPLAADEAHVVNALSRAGFSGTQRYPNRTVVDAVGPAAAAERYFETEIHRFVQPAHGLRYATVRPAAMPAELRASVAGVSGLSNLIHLHPTIAFASPAQKARAAKRALALADGFGARLVGTRVTGWHPPTLPRAPRSIGNALADPSFESGRFGSWQPFTILPDAIIQDRVSHSGKYAAYIGPQTSTSGEFNGDSGVAQALTVPTNGVLSFWVRQGSNEPNPESSWQEADLLDYSGRRLVNFFATVNNDTHWRQVTYNVGASAGRRMYLYFGIHGNGTAHRRTFQYIDDVRLAGSAYPGSGAPISGPLTGPDGGFGPAVIAHDYDLPVQHQFDGAGRATGIAISVHGYDLVTGIGSVHGYIFSHFE